MYCLAQESLKNDQMIKLTGSENVKNLLVDLEDLWDLGQDEAHVEDGRDHQNKEKITP